MDALQDRVTVPEPMIDVELRVTERLVELVMTARLTTPVKPLTAVTVIVETPLEPTLALTLVGLAVTVKSWTLYVAVALWDGVVELLPVTVAR